MLPMTVARSFSGDVLIRYVYTSGFVDDVMFSQWTLWRSNATASVSLQCAYDLTPLSRVTGRVLGTRRVVRAGVAGRSVHCTIALLLESSLIMASAYTLKPVRILRHVRIAESE